MSTRQIIEAVAILLVMIGAWCSGYVVGARNEARWWATKITRDDTQIPEGMVRVAVPGRAPVCVPINADEADVRRVVEIARGEDD